MFALLLTLAAVSAPAATTRDLFTGAEPGVFTVEVHTGNVDAKSTLGSGYLASGDGLIVTNYHVVGSYIDSPDRFRIRVRNQRGEHEASLVNFDLFNDLAVLRASDVRAAPLKIEASASEAVGNSIVSLGNPHGFRLSIVDGIYNGFAEKGLVDRMMLSMPLNPGMSGGPILNRAGNVIGTNVSVVWLSNNLSFGVPAVHLRSLLDKPPLERDKKVYHREMHDQLLRAEEATFDRVRTSFLEDEDQNAVKVGRARFARPPSVFNCWDSSDKYESRGISIATHGCNLQFTPMLADAGEVASIEMWMGHLASERGRYGFYGYLSRYAQDHHDVPSESLLTAVRTAPECVADRVAVGDLRWKINTCVNAYMGHSDLFDFSMASTTLNRGNEAIYIVLQVRAFRLSSFTRLAEHVLRHARFEGMP